MSKKPGNTGNKDERINKVLSSRDAALQLVNELEWSKRELEVEVRRRKKIEKVLKKSYLRLKGAVRAEKAAGRSKSEFLATMSHEIRTPLNSILGFLTLLKQTALSPDQVEYTNIVHGASEGLLLLINDILDISRVEAGRLELDPEPFNLYELLGGICEMMAVRARIKGLELNWQIKKGTPVNLRGDVVRLRQVFVNLLGNAVKFTGSGEIVLMAEKKEVDGRVITLGFSVSDTGTGVSEHDREKIFDRFCQAEGSASGECRGAGLGLYISKIIVELMGGEIGVRNNCGGGSVFFFRVKLEFSEDLSSGDIPAGSPEREITEDSFKDPVKHILLADDNRDNQVIVRKYLEKCNYQLHVVSNGEEAVGAVKERSFDLVLMDLNMPVMDGYQATEAIRKLKSGSNVPIVAITALVFREDIEKTRKCGMDDYISKPLMMNELIAKIKEVLKRGGQCQAQ